MERAAFLAIFFMGIAGAQNPLRDSLSEATARNNAAVRLASEGRVVEAEKLYLAALDARYDDDLARAKIANNLAGLYQRQDRFRDAENMFRRALELRQKNLPASSIEVAYSLNNLGEMYRVEGRDWEARNLMGPAVRSLQQFHAEAPGLPIILSNLAMVVCRFADFDQAEEMLRAALLLYEKRRESGSEYGVTISDLGQVKEAKGERDAAVPLFEQAIGVFEHLDPPAKPELAATLANMGRLYQRLNRVEDARQAEERALDLLRPAADGALRAQILRNLGNIVASTGNPADSLPYFQQSLLIQEKTLGEEHPATASLLLDYSSASQRAGKTSLARKLRKRAADLLARINSQSPDQMTVSVRDLLASK